MTNCANMRSVSKHSPTMMSSTLTVSEPKPLMPLQTKTPVSSSLAFLILRKRLAALCRSHVKST